MGQPGATIRLHHLAPLTVIGRCLPEDAPRTPIRAVSTTVPHACFAARDQIFGIPWPRLPIGLFRDPRAVCVSGGGTGVVLDGPCVRYGR